MEHSEPTSPSARHAPDHDSMVTVALSDNQSSSEHTQPDWRTLDIPPTPIEMSHPEKESEEAFEPVPLRHAARTTPTPQNRDSNGGRQPGEMFDNEGDWENLDKTEEQEPRGEGSDESTALLLARLEQENNALATNPKSGIHEIPEGKVPGKIHQRQSRSESLHQIKRLIRDPARAELRYSQLPPPPMTELQFWAALVADYHQTAQRLPTLTSNKIQGGVPPPLRGVVWPSLAGARDPTLLHEFQRLSGESSPYDGLIGKDIGRSFPNVEMFRDPNGEGQQMLFRVLRCFSLYDTKIGYCQGLGFVVGPLLMHMSDAEAFCVLVRLMDHYNLRTCYLPDLSGLHLHVYQFQNLLARHRPALFQHLESLHVEPVYVSQWFLSFFAVACPLPMLLRIYDVIFLEGACETLMRVALSLMQRNEKRILACTEFEDVMQLLLSRSLWDAYAFNADDLVNDFVSLTSLVTNESLQTLEASYNQSKGSPAGVSFPQMQATASGFLGRLWAGSSNSHNSTRSLTPNSSRSRHNSTVRRSTSKQSLTSTLNSIDTISDASTAPTELSATMASTDGQKPRVKSSMSSHHKDRDLHTQIEDLLMALSDLQRQQADLTRELQQEREEREEDHTLAKEMLKEIRELPIESHLTELVNKAQARFESAKPKRGSITQTKIQLNDDVLRWKEMHEVEAGRCLNLTRRIDDFEHENSSLKEQLREARGRIQDGYRDRQRLEHMNRELRTLKTPISESMTPLDTSPTSAVDSDAQSPTSGLRELKLVRSNSIKSPTYNKRTSSLSASRALPTESNKPTEDSLLMELVNAKTAEAVARQELEEVKGKFDALRRMAAKNEGRHSFVGLSQSRISLANTSLAEAPRTLGTPPSNNAGGGFFSGWGRRAATANGVLRGVAGGFRFSKALFRCGRPVSGGAFEESIDPFPSDYAGEQPRDSPQVINNPYPDYDSVNWMSTSRGSYQPCIGPQGRLLSRRDEDMMMSGFRWNTSDFPTPIFGSYDSWKLNNSLCADRYSRYGAYGYAESNETTRIHGWQGTFGSNEAAEIDWEQVNWGDLQHDCLQRNIIRYRKEASERKISALYKSLELDLQEPREPLNDTKPSAHPRTAILLRSWIGMKYTENDLHHIRSMMMELSLYSGAEYELVLLIDCQDEKLPAETDMAAWKAFKQKHLPQELHGLAVWFNEEMLNDWYPDIDIHVAILQYFQPTQIFSRLHPQYDYVWQFEMDARYTGHMYDLLHKATEFAKQQPRKYLWERNSHFYIPAIHGRWEEFVKKVDQEMPGRDNDSVWGPHPAEGINTEGKAIIPPVPLPGDEPGTWGVGEEADLITWLPHFNPVGTDWPFRDRVFNFPQDQETPRRAAVVAMSRISTRLLGLLHKDKVKLGVGLASEMSPLSWAMYYGLKAVQIPQPIYHDSKWDPEELNRRANPGEPGKVNAGFDSIWSWGQHDDIIYNMTFMFNSNFAEKLYRAWLGYDGAKVWEKQNPRLCLPPIFLHPVKNLEPVKTKPH
ncbi:hypothetical protein N7457_007567 [Penicillium paradoxum]|uniref:uncharacterized protein n=1 Tax=Penicillium paradoxum TaxID=176176 RepID=UPI00254786BF|nr:uncharacterized protein N7457_007567 [Penicillium paradoxum]KAJ5779847.1 hypothetical protein N7457_007567 [Penicillium paradoxum]